jgi:hypothetical protein
MLLSRAPAVASASVRYGPIFEAFVGWQARVDALRHLALWRYLENKKQVMQRATYSAA